MTGVVAGRPRLSRLPSTALAAVPQLLQVGPRLLTLIATAEDVLARIVELVEEIEQTRRQIVCVTDRADTAVALGTAVAAEAAEVTTTVNKLLTAYEAPLRSAQPHLAHLADNVGPVETDALVSALVRTPEVLSAFENDVLPILQNLKTVAPDLTDLLDTSRTLNEMLGGLPGLGRIKKRIDKEADDGDDDLDSNADPEPAG